MLETSFSCPIAIIVHFFDYERVLQTAFNFQEKACGSTDSLQESEYDCAGDHATWRVIGLIKSQIYIAFIELSSWPFELNQLGLLLNYNLWLNCADWLHNHLVLNTINELCLRLHTSHRDRLHASSCHRLHTRSHHWLHAASYHRLHAPYHHWLHTICRHRLRTGRRHLLHARSSNWHHLLLPGHHWCRHHHRLPIGAHRHHLLWHLRLLNTSFHIHIHHHWLSYCCCYSNHRFLLRLAYIRFL